MTKEQILKAVLEGLESNVLSVDGTLYIDGTPLFNNTPIEVPETNADRFGNLPPDTAHNGCRNIIAEAKIREALQSDDHFIVEAAKLFPSRLVIMGEYFKPERLTNEWMAVWRNNTRQWAWTGNNNRITDYFDKQGNIVPDHGFVCGHDSTYPNSKGHASFLADLPKYVDFWLEDKADSLKGGGLREPG